GQRLELLDNVDRRKRLPIQSNGTTVLERNDVTLRLARIREGIARDHPRMVGNAARGGECFLATDRDTPEATVGRIGGAVGRHGQLALLQVFQLLLALERPV